ncbi:MAG TPA: carbonic anhydrase [Anaerolineaceae bacterium]|nr:carbonic anhydrase [Anaerolineaceae bacterium]HPN51852.1 carbonic anhydrase [Anaerolineaceae bacterium]
MELQPITRRTFLKGLGVTLTGLVVAGCERSATTATPVNPLNELPITAPDGAIRRLWEGGQRFVSNQMIRPNQTMTRRKELTKGQKPFATIFSCVDSRVPPELIFDRGLGDLFVIRTAGHVLDRAALGSIQFGVEELAIPLIVVLGHSSCGAVKATVELTEKQGKAAGSIQYLVDYITPAVREAEELPGTLLDNTISVNIMRTVESLAESPIIKEAVEEGRVKILGARYDLTTGGSQGVISKP